MNNPVLRFKKSVGEWQPKKLGEIVSIFSGFAFRSTDSRQNGVRWLKISDVGIQRMEHSTPSFLPDDLKHTYKNFLVCEGDYVIALTRPILGNRLKVAKVDATYNESLLNQRVGKLLSNQNLDFIYLLLQLKSTISKIDDKISGTDPPNLSVTALKEIEVRIPSDPNEQEKIADFFRCIDKKIDLLRERRLLLESFKHGVMQKIFSHEIALKDKNNESYPDWVKTKLRSLLTEHKQTNKNGGYSEVFSVAKVNGVVNQIEHLGRSYASKDLSTYKVVFPNDIVYTKSPTSGFPFGVIKQNKTMRTGLVSSLYAVFTPTTSALGALLEQYFSRWEVTFNYLKPIARKGAKNTINIGNDEFLDGAEILIPPTTEEYERLSSFLTVLDSKIATTSTQEDLVKQYKQGLLQQMFV
jgi:type I restriction enzyme, S subunit